ncbi:hypothetical protein AWH04_09005 [Rhodococcus erythropolis]|nr:hypothetical protein AWH04_09005 [Rhodococcus erythropolis]
MLDLNEEDRQVVLDAIEQFNRDGDADDEPSDEGLLPAYSALRTVRSVVAEQGLADVLEDIRASYADDDIEHKLAPLLRYLQPTEAESEMAFIRDVENSTVPVLTEGKFELDYRVAERDGKLKLVPLFIARLGFDESVGGSDTAVFQLTGSTLVKMRKQIDDALSLLERSAALVNEDCLPASFVGKLGVDK